MNQSYNSGPLSIGTRNQLDETWSIMAVAPGSHRRGKFTIFPGNMWPIYPPGNLEWGVLEATPINVVVHMAVNVSIL